MVWDPPNLQPHCVPKKRPRFIHMTCHERLVTCENKGKLGNLDPKFVLTNPMDMTIFYSNSMIHSKVKWSPNQLSYCRKYGERNIMLRYLEYPITRPFVGSTESRSLLYPLAAEQYFFDHGHQGTRPFIISYVYVKILLCANFTRNHRPISVFQYTKPILQRIPRQSFHKSSVPLLLFNAGLFSF